MGNETYTVKDEKTEISFSSFEIRFFGRGEFWRYADREDSPRSFPHSHRSSDLDLPLIPFHACGRERLNQRQQLVYYFISEMYLTPSQYIDRYSTVALS
jgi:hypothetical protein